MDLNVISKLIQMLENSRLNTLEIEEGEFKIKLGKGGLETTKQVQAAPVVNYVPQVEQVVETSVKEVEAEPQKIVDENCTIVKSPIVGTFYSSSSPTSEAFVKVGSTVKEGQILCIIEAMKLMNEIESECNGEVVEVLVENGQMVEYGQPLFKIK